MSVLCSLGQILKQVPTAEMQTVSWESAYPAGRWLPPSLPTPPQRPNSKTGLPDVSPEALMDGPKPQPAGVHSPGQRDEQDNGYSQAG